MTLPRCQPCQAETSFSGWALSGHYPGSGCPQTCLWSVVSVLVIVNPVRGSWTEKATESGQRGPSGQRGRASQAAGWGHTGRHGTGMGLGATVGTGPTTPEWMPVRSSFLLAASFGADTASLCTACFEACGEGSPSTGRLRLAGHPERRRTPTVSVTNTSEKLPTPRAARPQNSASGPIEGELCEKRRRLGLPDGSSHLELLSHPVHALPGGVASEQGIFGGCLAMAGCSASPGCVHPAQPCRWATLPGVGVPSGGVLERRCGLGEQTGQGLCSCGASGALSAHPALLAGRHGALSWKAVAKQARRVLVSLPLREDRSR